MADQLTGVLDCFIKKKVSFSIQVNFPSPPLLTSPSPPVTLEEGSGGTGVGGGGSRNLSQPPVIVVIRRCSYSPGWSRDGFPCAGDSGFVGFQELSVL